MQRSFKSWLLVSALAILAVGVSAGAHAGTSIHVSVGGPAVVTPVVPVYQQPSYAPAGHVVPVQQVDGGAYRNAVPAQAACGAPRWDPRVRYMPGQVVWRHGDLWVARGVSARVYNENSPPEWTPQYWTPAMCR